MRAHAAEPSTVVEGQRTLRPMPARPAVTLRHVPRAWSSHELIATAMRRRNGQGRCACGGTAGRDGECAGCRAKRLAAIHSQGFAAQGQAMGGEEERSPAAEEAGQRPPSAISPAGAHAESALDAGPAVMAPEALPAGLEPSTGEPAQTAPVAAPAACVPSRALTWVDFTGTPSGPASFGAKTVAPIAEVTAGGATRFQAQFDSARSWVRPRYSSPSNRASTSCGSQVGACESYFAGLKTGQTGEWSFDGAADPGCAAAVVPSSTPKATSRAECDPVIGGECDRAMGLESARLLRHEQLHFDIACQIARKANTALAAGTAIATVRSAVSAKAQPAQDQYDTDSSHGCDATGQSTWETSVSGALTSVTIP